MEFNKILICGLVINNYMEKIGKKFAKIIMTFLDIFAKEKSTSDWPQNLLLKEYSTVLWCFICQLNDRKIIFMWLKNFIYYNKI